LRLSTNSFDLTLSGTHGLYGDDDGIFNPHVRVIGAVDDRTGNFPTSSVSSESVHGKHRRRSACEELPMPRFEREGNYQLEPGFLFFRRWPFVHVLLLDGENSRSDNSGQLLRRVRSLSSRIDGVLTVLNHHPGICFVACHRKGNRSSRERNERKSSADRSSPLPTTRYRSTAECRLELEIQQ